MAERDSKGRFVAKPKADDEVSVGASERPQQSDTDALGLDKRRQVVGGQYSASLSRQIITYAIVVVVVVGAGIGVKALADNLDQPPSKVADQAPWTGSDKPPPPIQ